MRAHAFAIALAALINLPAAAQNSRVSFELGLGVGSTSDIFRQELIYPPSGPSTGGTSTTRLSVGGGSFGSARVAFRVAGPWLLVGEVTDGSSDYHYGESFVAPLGVSTLDQTGVARRSAFGIGVARRTALGALPLFIEPELGFALQRLRVGQTTECVPTAPTLGSTGPSCIPSERWERTYTAPSVRGGLSVGYAVLPRVTVLLRGLYSVGRTSTEEGVYTDLLPQFDWEEAPKTQTVRTSQVSVGFRFAP